MQNATDLGILYQCEEYACMLYIILLRAHFSQNVKYWYEMRYLYLPRAVWILYQFFQGVNFAKCEICGSTRPSVKVYNASA